MDLQLKIVVEDSDRDTGATDELDLKVKLVNLNDNDPALTGDARIPVAENTPRDNVLATYTATDADGDIDGDGVAVTYGIRDGQSKSFRINQDGELLTVESLDYDSNPGKPCPRPETVPSRYMLVTASVKTRLT